MIARRVAGIFVVCLLIALSPPQSIAGEAPPLVDAAWVARNLDTGDIRFLDIRSNGHGAFLRAHVPGAMFSDYGRAGWRTTNAAGVPGMLPPIDQLERLISRLGITNQHHVVIIAHGKGAIEMASATRVYWTFKVLGHDAVSILDGGMAAYVDEKTEAGEQAVVRTKFNAHYRAELVATKAELANDPSIALIDSRPSPQFAGEAKHPAAARAGTIPDADNLPLTRLADRRGRFKSRAELDALMTSAAIPADGPTDGAIACFCNTGHMASMGWFVAYALLGNHNAALYDGSMVEWSADASLPVVKGKP